MELTTQRKLLHAAAAGFMAIGVGSAVWSISSLPNASHATTGDARSIRSIASSRPLETETGRGDQDQIDLSMPLQKPLYDPPKPPPAAPRPKPIVARKTPPPVVKKPRLDWTLTGTIIDSQRSVAILTDASGKSDIRGEGERVELSPEGVLVQKIESDQVTLDVNGKRSTLKLEQSFSGSGARGGSGNLDRQNRRRNR